MHRLLSFLVAILFPLLSLAQDVIYFDKDWKLVDKKRHAAYYRPLPQKDGTAYKLVDYYKNGKKQMVGYYTASDVQQLMLEPVGEASKNGKFTYYYANGKTKAEEQYADGLPHGEFKNYDETGKAVSKEQYENGKKSGEWIRYYEGSTQPWLVSNYIYDKINGEMKSYYPDGKIKRDAVYTNGSMASGKMFDEQGNSIPFTEFETMPEPGFDLNKFLSGNTVYPDKARSRNIEGRVLVKFYVDESGQVTNPEVTQSVHPELDKEALRVVNLMPLWKPGKIDDKPIKVYYTLPMLFKLD